MQSGAFRALGAKENLDVRLDRQRRFCTRGEQDHEEQVQPDGPAESTVGEMEGAFNTGICGFIHSRGVFKTGY